MADWKAGGIFINLIDVTFNKRFKMLVMVAGWEI